MLSLVFLVCGLRRAIGGKYAFQPSLDSDEEDVRSIISGLDDIVLIED